VAKIAETASHVAAARSRLVASPDGSHAAVVEPGRIVIVELRRAVQVAEIGAAAALDQTDVAWLGPTPRLLVLSRHGTHVTVHLIDIDGPRAVVEIRIEGTMRIGAAVGGQALVIGAGSMAVLIAGEAHLTPYQFPGRSLPSAAGVAAQQVIVAVAGAIEEWDLLLRTPRKRLRLPRQVSIVQLGGTERVVWMTTQQNPARIDVIPQLNRGQPHAHELPEPIAQVAGHPRHDTLACIGRDSGRLYLVDLDGKAAPRTIEVPGLDRIDSAAMFADPALAVIVARAGQPLAVIGLDGGAAAAASRAALTVPAAGTADLDDGDESGDDAASRSSLYDPAPPAPAPPAPPTRPAGLRLDEPAAPPPPISRPPTPAPLAPPPPVSRPTPSPVAPTPSATPPPRAGLASLQMRTAPRIVRPARKPDPDPEPAPPARPDAPPRLHAEPVRPRPREIDAPPPPPIIRPPIEHAIAALAPRASRATASPSDDLLDHLRRFVAATALRAIAHDWDTGRLASAAPDRPPFEAEVLALAGGTRGLAPVRVAEAAQALDAATTALTTARAALAGPSPLDRLCAEHGIDATGELVLLFAAAPSLWGELARLYTILASDAGRPTCDEHLLWQLLGHTLARRDLARALDPNGPLVHHGLLRLDDRERPFQRVTADPIVVKRISDAAIDDAVDPGVTRVAAIVALDQLSIPGRVIDRALVDLAAAPAGRARLVVTGGSGSGRRTLLAALAQLAGRTLATIDAAPLVRDRRLAALATLLQRADLRDELPCIDGLDAVASPDSHLRDLLRDHHGPLAIRLTRHAPSPLAPGFVAIDLPRSTPAERAAQWTEILGATGLAVRDLDELTARFAVGPGTIKAIATAVARAAPADPEPAIIAALRHTLETKLGAIATREPRLATWGQIVLPADIHDRIVELIARIRHHRTVYDTWGFEPATTTARGLIAVFQGGPGTGKTLIARAIANELGLDLYRVDLSSALAPRLGEPDLADVLDAAEQGQALVLFDHADAVLGAPALLHRLDRFDGIAVLTTRAGAAIDPALERRLSCQLTLPFPDDKAREQLWRIHLPEQLPLAGKLDLADLARRHKLTGGAIRNAAVRAAFLAAEEHVPLSQDHLERAVRAAGEPAA
jgi:hypothetical protein